MWDKLWVPVTLYFAVINIVAFAAFGADKSRAQRGLWRIPEKTLLLLCFLGGGLGGFIAMRTFRHKTRHLKFQILVPLSILVYAGAALFLVIKFL